MNGIRIILKWDNFKKYFKLLKIFKVMIETKYYHVDSADMIYETMKSLDGGVVKVS